MTSANADADSKIQKQTDNGARPGKAG